MKSSFVAVNEFMRPLTRSLIFEKNSKVKFWYFFLGWFLLLWDRCGSFWDSPRSFEDRCGSLWIIVDCCGSLWVLPGFSNYVISKFHSTWLKIPVIPTECPSTKKFGTSPYCSFAHDVTAVMLVVKNKSISLHWELNSIFMYIFRAKFLLYWPPL